MKTQNIPPNVSNFVKSLRDIGYTLEIAVADILDNRNMVIKIIVEITYVNFTF
jgi:hypothetical protein